MAKVRAEQLSSIDRREREKSTPSLDVSALVMSKFLDHRFLAENALS